jgi:hypothetical protein
LLQTLGRRLTCRVPLRLETSDDLGRLIATSTLIRKLVGALLLTFIFGDACAIGSRLTPRGASCRQIVLGLLLLEVVAAGYAETQEPTGDDRHPLVHASEHNGDESLVP